MTQSRAMVLSVLMGLACTAEAAVLEADDAIFGVGALTRDTDQALDFLDLTLSTARSFDDVSGELGAGGDFDGFHHATEAEVIDLINNFGFIPAAAANAITTGTTGGDQLSGLVSLLGVTAVLGSNRAWGLTGTMGACCGPFYRTVDIRDLVAADADDEVNSLSFDLVSSVSVAGIGHFLVRTAPVGVPGVPEPASIILLAGGIAGFALTRRRRLA